ncbi:MAG: hypothetical protein ABR589_05565 [Chthoniobacterales bacterium]
MHKDPPPGLLERPIGVVVIYGLLIGIVAGVLVFGVWSFFSTVNDRGERSEPPLVQPARPLP